MKVWIRTLLTLVLAFGILGCEEKIFRSEPGLAEIVIVNDEGTKVRFLSDQSIWHRGGIWGEVGDTILAQKSWSDGGRREWHDLSTGQVGTLCYVRPYQKWKSPTSSAGQVGLAEIIRVDRYITVRLLADRSVWRKGGSWGKVGDTISVETEEYRGGGFQDDCGEFFLRQRWVTPQTGEQEGLAEILIANEGGTMVKFLSDQSIWNREGVWGEVGDTILAQKNGRDYSGFGVWGSATGR